MTCDVSSGALDPNMDSGATHGLGGQGPQKCSAPTVKHIGKQSEGDCVKFSDFGRFCSQNL